mgnify:FL=1
MPSPRTRSAPRRARRAAAIALLTVAPSLTAQSVDSVHPEDIPRPMPGDLGLAGSPTPDIARFLAVRTASDASLSRDGAQLSFITSTTVPPPL